MRKLLTLIILASLAFTGCTDSKCLTFNKENFKEKLEEIGKTENYTKTEKAMLAGYFMQYAIVSGTGELASNPFAAALRKKATESDYQEYSNTCDVLTHVREQLKKQGKTEEQYAVEMEDAVNSMQNLDNPK